MKRIIKLFAIVFVVGLLSGCISIESDDGNSKEKDNIINTENSKEKVFIDDSTINNNFINAATQSGIDKSKIKEFKKIDDWINGTRYSFVYLGNYFLLYVNDNKKISSINIGNSDDPVNIKIFEENFEPLDVKNFIVDFDNMIDLQLVVEKRVKDYLNNPTTAKFQLSTNANYGRYYNYFTVKSIVNSKNSFGVDKDIEFYVELKKENDEYKVVYLILGGEKRIGDKSYILPINKKQIIDEGTEEGEKSITLKEGVMGEFGRKDLFDGEEYIRYYLPEGKYEVESLSKNATIFVESIRIYKEDGFDISDVIERIDFNKSGQKKTISINKNSCVTLTLYSNLKLIKVE